MVCKCSGKGHAAFIFAAEEETGTLIWCELPGPQRQDLSCWLVSPITNSLVPAEQWGRYLEEHSMERMCSAKVLRESAGRYSQIQMVWCITRA